MNDELARCPFCGNRKHFKVNENDDEIGRRCHVWCAGCGTSGPPMRSRKAAIRAWNRRHGVKAQANASSAT